MADTVINLSGLENRVRMVQDAVQRVEYGLNQNNEKVDLMSQQLRAATGELQELKEQFQRYMEQAAKNATLQKAATELVRVRQELEQHYGGYKVVRNTMLGVLQATDLALVKKTTISQVTEELMLSTPDYWLAPCLVAVSAWIGNDRDLASRAIAEAVRRDEEKTALTMALICRRNNRTATCYEWLSLYFSRQDAASFTESSFTYLNAYLNGVFGPDENHMCDDYVAKWMGEIQDNTEDLDAKQSDQWKEYCSNFTVDLDAQFPKLKACVQEYPDISAYIGRIGSVDAIRDNFYSMKNVNVDQQKLKKNIDANLVSIISQYDGREEPLRKEEQYLKAIRELDGDTEAAKQKILQAAAARKENTIDLISQMTNIIVKKENAAPSERKTSVSFLSDYIRHGFQDYITEKKDSFPKAITLNVNGWQGSTQGGTGAEELKVEFARAMEVRKNQELAELPVKRPKILQIAAIVIAVLSLILMFAVNPVLGVVGLLGAVGCFVYSLTFVKTLAKRAEQIKASYAENIAAGSAVIDGTMEEWGRARELVDSFESGKIPDIVA